MGEFPTAEQLQTLREQGWLIVSTLKGIRATRRDHPGALLPWRDALGPTERETRDADRTLKLPVRDPDEIVSVKTCAELPDHLDGDDADTLREVLIFFHQISLRAGKSISVGQIDQLFEGFDADERRAMIDVARHRAGLPSRKAIESRARFEAAQQEARRVSAETSVLQVCAEANCKTYPIDAITGLLVPVDVVRWFARHIATWPARPTCSRDRVPCASDRLARSSR